MKPPNLNGLNLHGAGPRRRAPVRLPPEPEPREEWPEVPQERRWPNADVGRALANEAVGFRTQLGTTEFLEGLGNPDAIRALLAAIVRGLTKIEADDAGGHMIIWLAKIEARLRDMGAAERAEASAVADGMLEVLNRGEGRKQR